MKKFLSALIACALLAPCACAQTAANDQAQMTGILVDAAMHSLLIEWQNGETYAFHREGDEDTAGLLGGLYLGNVVTVSYEGKIDWAERDTSGAKLTAISDGALTAEMVLPEFVEGEEELSLMTWVNSGLGFGAFIDTAAYDWARTDGVFAVSPVDGLSGVRLSVQKFPGGDIAALAEGAKGDLRARGFEISVAEAELGGEEVEGLRADANGLCEEVYLYGQMDNAHLVRLTFPREAEEGFGARLRAMMARIAFTDDLGRAPALVYGPDADYNWLSPREAMAVPTPQGYVSALYEIGALDTPVTVLSAEIRGGTLALDMSRGFGQMLSSTGTAGEYIMMGSLVNTMIAAYGVESVYVTCMQEVIQTGHSVYDEPLAFYEGNA